ncbi:hypothetical protein CVV38_02570 [Candidatus Peregrinibacteria bacterium HGW-Peregrinibacteria-1]|jgi:AraC family transcriptional regulator of adaptative response/methylated-DNA-[protein]-cysteine methyltransferase|nr:MAG: hypothetical protein CVV38_02570 [Candidatus Peregrinibacteria bacterium HGW-Peregrinibacteria-1]
MKLRPAKIIPMTSQEWSSAKRLSVTYSFIESNIGKLIVASSQKGICFLAFYDSQTNPTKELQQAFPQANLLHKQQPIHLAAQELYQTHSSNIATKSDISHLPLHIKGTDFQHQVWETLLDIPYGQTRTYQDIARKINNPKATRAVGTAIGQNPIAIIIPCHRVITKSGKLGGYKWGADLKASILRHEVGNSQKGEM